MPGSGLHRLLKKAHLPIALSVVEGCTQSTRSNVPTKYASARRFLARLASETFLNSLESKFYNTLCRAEDRESPSSILYFLSSMAIVSLSLFHQPASFFNTRSSCRRNSWSFFSRSSARVTAWHGVDNSFT
jgi:hypothetical protein